MAASSTYFGLYDPNSVNLLINGLAITGFAEGTFINIERNEDVFEPYIGGKGDVTRVLNVNTTYSVTFTLMQNSQANAAMQAILTVDRFAGVPPLLNCTLDDVYGVENFTSKFGWMNTEASRGFANGMETREWTIFCPDGIWVPNAGRYGKNDKSPIQGGDNGVQV